VAEEKNVRKDRKNELNSLSDVDNLNEWRGVEQDKCFGDLAGERIKKKATMKS
jgi:hypothetical protein